MYTRRKRGNQSHKVTSLYIHGYIFEMWEYGTGVTRVSESSSPGCLWNEAAQELTEEALDG